MNIPVVHIQCGEVSGTIDESIRHAVSKFSHYHLVSNNDAKNRLIKMGEIPKHVFVVGCPSIDAMLDIDISSSVEIKKKFNIDVHKKFFLVLQHPVSTELHNAKKQIKETLKAVKKSGVESVLIYPNNTKFRLNGMCSFINPHSLIFAFNKFASLRCIYYI